MQKNINTRARAGPQNCGVRHRPRKLVQIIFFTFPDGSRGRLFLIYRPTKQASHNLQDPAKKLIKIINGHHGQLQRVDRLMRVNGWSWELLPVRIVPYQVAAQYFDSMVTLDTFGIDTDGHC